MSSHSQACGALPIQASSVRAQTSPAESRCGCGSQDTGCQAHTRTETRGPRMCVPDTTTGACVCVCVCVCVFTQICTLRSCVYAQTRMQGNAHLAVFPMCTLAHESTPVRAVFPVWASMCVCVGVGVALRAEFGSARGSITRSASSTRYLSGARHSGLPCHAADTPSQHHTAEGHWQRTEQQTRVRYGCMSVL